MTLPGREAIEVEALRTDHYLEALLAAGERRALDTPSDSRLDPAIRIAARRLQRELTRVHPSFRFEERLAARLASIADGMRLPVAAGHDGRVVAFSGTSEPAQDPDRVDPLGPDPEGEPGLARPLLIGGAMASAALSIAGAAFVAWWRLRPPTTPMGRAVRAARQLRLGRTVSSPGARRASRARVGLH
jgi:hypothetical protein